MAILKKNEFGRWIEFETHTPGCEEVAFDHYLTMVFDRYAICSWFPSRETFQKIEIEVLEGIPATRCSVILSGEWAILSKGVNDRVTLALYRHYGWEPKKYEYFLSSRSETGIRQAYELALQRGIPLTRGITSDGDVWRTSQAMNRTQVTTGVRPASSWDRKQEFIKDVS